ncbi:GFA family protein [Thalassotalea sp. G2M2-11]|uniref:GFA family protein n=1 Tax=Thalassotalea sp. G2M2-11 TaxID=2787627 RepID=UPI0019D0FEF2|nr:GFA family protein [Thalassotalea sp. G2M2-11]
MTKLNKTTNHGSCLCGKICFQVTEFLPLVGHCHCTMCRKFHGAAFSTYAEVKRQDVHWLSGEELLSSYRADNGTVRKFCQNCGTSLLFESQYNRRDNTIEIAIATFDNIEHVTPSAHIYIGSKVDWLTINDELPQFLAYRK